MYFFNLQKLKTQLISKPHSDKELLPYLIATLLLITLIEYLPKSAVYNQWDYLEIAIVVLFSVFGTLWLYKRNGGDTGSHFLQRYFALGWVALIRVSVFSLPAIIVLLALGAYAGFIQTELDTKSWFDFLIIVFFELFYYWYLGKHLAEVAHHANDNARNQT